jgi:hypothetical protein
VVAASRPSGLRDHPERRCGFARPQPGPSDRAPRLVPLVPFPSDRAAPRARGRSERGATVARAPGAVRRAPRPRVRRRPSRDPGGERARGRGVTAFGVARPSGAALWFRATSARPERPRTAARALVPFPSDRAAPGARGRSERGATVARAPGAVRRAPRPRVRRRPSRDPGGERARGRGVTAFGVARPSDPERRCGSARPQPGPSDRAPRLVPLCRSRAIERLRAPAAGPSEVPPWLVPLVPFAVRRGRGFADVRLGIREESGLVVAASRPSGSRDHPERRCGSARRPGAIGRSGPDRFAAPTSRGGARGSGGT